jgi:hypothetical protein
MDVSMFKDLPRDRVEHYEAFKDASWPNISNEQGLANLPTHILDEVNLDFDSKVAPDYVRTLRQMVTPDLETFQGLTFLDWSNQNNFAVTELLHPLEDAHKAAADLLRDRYRAMLEI